MKVPQVLQEFDRNASAVWVLRSGLAFVFLYAALGSLQHPVEWIGFLPGFLTNIVAASLLLKLFAIAELVLAVWLVSGRYVRYAALAAALLLVGIVVSNPAALGTTFRDAGLALAAVALALLEEK